MPTLNLLKINDKFIFFGFGENKTVRNRTLGVRY